MATSRQEPVHIDTAADHLATYAFDKGGLTEILSRIPASEGTDRVGLEYEAQLLKIITVGWGISYFMEGRGEKQALVKASWSGIQAFSQNLDSVTSMMTGTQIDYFQTIRQRLDTYLTALRQQPEATDPVAVFGPTYAECCGHADNVHVIMAGNRVFSGTLQAVREYLVHIAFESP
ncbi:MAG: hypothetical protein JEZ11_15295 [Desulfobacterales bacterium]|nr:hypothetical protein [Desulfobacterales bacterium]